MTDPDFIRQTLDALQSQGLRRRLIEVGSAAGPHIKVRGRTVLAFASNNYLGLANEPRVREAAKRAIDRWGWGAGASRLVSGHTEAHAALEADLAAFKHTGAAVVFPTGYMANLGLVSAMAGRADVVLADRENHASLYDAIRLSGARLERYPHCDAAAAMGILDKHRGQPGNRLLVTDTVFSMGGDPAPLEALMPVHAEGVLVLVDEAHATGVFGPTGAGLAEALGAGEGITATVGTLSKALGGIGGFVAASREVCQLLVNRARSFIYTTALPAAACEAAREALRIAQAEPERRQRLLQMAKNLRQALQAKGFDIGRSASQIVPVIVGQPERAMAMAAALMDQGIFCPAIRPPSVPPGTSRLRISLTSEHTEDDAARLVEALAQARDI
jgi:8-amino-7-oxononanoate synthase